MSPGSMISNRKYLVSFLVFFKRKTKAITIRVRTTKFKIKALIAPDGRFNDV
jgi:hypothetical protein